MSDIEKQLPEKKFRAGAVSATVWKNNRINSKGETFTTYSISLERSYTDKEGKWNSTNSLRVNDLPKAELVSRLAYEFLVTKKADSAENESAAA